MLSMFGFIKKELEDKGQLISKYREWKNTLYDGLERFMEASIPAMYEDLKDSSYDRYAKGYELLSPYTQDIPVNLAAKDWQLQFRADVIDIASVPDQDIAAWRQLCLQIESSTGSILFRLKINGPTTTFYLYEPDKGYVSSINDQSIVMGANYLRWDYKASTKTLTAYYSKNDSSWTRIGYYTIKHPELMKKIAVWQGHTKATIPVDGIKFIYDGEVLFGS